MASKHGLTKEPEGFSRPKSVVLFGGNQWLLYMWQSENDLGHTIINMELAPDRWSKKYVNVAGAWHYEAITFPGIDIRYQWRAMYQDMYNHIKEELEKASG